MTYTREKIIDRIQRWFELYGEPPRSADWNPSAARWSASEWRIERYHAGDPDTGELWPSLNSAKKAFDGRLTDAIKAAGFEPNRTGPPRRKRVEQMDTGRLPMHPAVRVALNAAHQEVRELVNKVEVRDRTIERLRDRPERKEVVSNTAPKTITKHVTDNRAVERMRRKFEAADARIVEMRQARDDARRAEREARDAATRTASKLERAEATINELRAERRELRSDGGRAEDRATATERELYLALNQIERLKADTRVVVKEAPERAVIVAAEADAGRARRDAHEAEVRAAKAEREYRELAAAVTGESRKLTGAEIAELRTRGPAGPVVLAKALDNLAKVRKSGTSPELVAALTQVMSAAANWKDRIK